MDKFGTYVWSGFALIQRFAAIRAMGNFNNGGPDGFTYFFKMVVAFKVFLGGFPPYFQPPAKFFATQIIT